MPLAKDVATKLREIAERLDTAPDANIPTPWLSFSRDYTGDDKAKFLAFVCLMPKPFEKVWTDTELTLKHKSEVMTIIARIDRSDVCEPIEPAKPAVYRCEPLLSDEEDASVAA